MGTAWRFHFLISQLIVCTISKTFALTPQQELEVLKKLPPSGYDKRSRPPIPHSHPFMDPSRILTRLRITSIENIDDMKMEFSIHATLQLKWNDRRLSFNVSGANKETDYVKITNVDQFWAPGAYFSNVRNNQLITPMELMKISPHGNVLYSSRVHITLGCPMNFRKYPFDEQICPLIITSQRYADADVKLEWNRVDDTPPVEVSTGGYLGLFTLLESDTNEFQKMSSEGGGEEHHHTCLQVHLKFSRSPKYYLLHVYIPFTMMVILSWSAFWLNVEAITARVLVGISALLVMANQIAYFNSKVPPTSYTKALDTWTGICLTFALAAFLESVVVNYLERRERKRDSKFSSSNLEVDIPLSTISVENVNQDETQGSGGVSMGDGSKDKGMFNQRVKNYLVQFKTKTQKVDGVSRVIFPFVFFLLVVLYFVYFLCLSAKQQSYNLECS